jgi:hypothetical protein
MELRQQPAEPHGKELVGSTSGIETSPAAIILIETFSSTLCQPKTAGKRREHRENGWQNQG